ncbi:phosphatase PAP2 family protein [Gelatiniphilus marinus]|uniref:Phosphatase PAP2 family protein n=1 Tax=Gelatiniphilus marinus TaxID=1759464 RepID=A0ABW5JPX2_9FLAO
MFKILIAIIKKTSKILIHNFGKYNVTLPHVIALLLTLVFVVVGISLFIELTETLTTDVLVAYDARVTDYIISFRSSALTNYFVFVTHVGDVYGYLTVLAISFFLSIVIFKRKKYVLQILVVLLLSALSNLVLKRIVNRARPSTEHLVPVETLSYPSGHAMSAMAFYGFLIYLSYKFKMNRFKKIAAIFISTLLILSIGISRIYLGVHFPSDILGGFIAGAIWVVFCIVLFNMIEVFRRNPKT